MTTNSKKDETKKSLILMTILTPLKSLSNLKAMIITGITRMKITYIQFVIANGKENTGLHPVLISY